MSSDGTGARKTGVAFEMHVAAALTKQATALRQKSVEGLNPLERALRGAVVHAPWANVPARLLVDLGWEARDANERRRIREGPAEKRGWREFGGDLLIERVDAPGALIMGQDKDHQKLSLGCLGRFLVVADDAHEHNTQVAGLPSGTPSALLCFPAESHITRRDSVKLGALQARRGMCMMSFDDFAPQSGRDPDNDDDDDADEPTVAARDCAHQHEGLPPGGVKRKIDEVVAVAVAVDDPIAPNAPPPLPSDAAVYAACKPKSSTDRTFQKKAIDAIVKTKGTHLVRAPPGCGKTAVVATVLGRLVTRVHATRGGGTSKPMLAFFIAPYIDHARQLLKRLKPAMVLQFGSANVIQFVADTNIPTVEALHNLVEHGTRVFVSTDASAHLLLELATTAVHDGHPILVVKDEAHYNSSTSAASTQLLALVGNAPAGSVGIACTATPNSDVMLLQGLKKTLEYPLKDAIAAGHCSDYEIVLPLVENLLLDTGEEALPIEARRIASEHALGAAALFCVTGMLHDGGRRCVAYARDVKEANALLGFLQRACAFEGVGCEAVLVLEGTKKRQALYNNFCDGSSYERKRLETSQRADKFRPIFRFLVAVQILDQCVDLHSCDSILIASPPTSTQDKASAHRAIQRLGRATRPKEGGQKAHVYIFSDQDNPWLQNLFDVLEVFDPGCDKRVRIASSNPITRFTKAIESLEHAQLEETKAAFKIGHSRDAKDQASAKHERRLAELCRLMLLVQDGHVDPTTKVLARMPKHDQGLERDPDNLGGFWSTVKFQNSHVAELKKRIDDKMDVDAFIASQRTEKTEFSKCSLIDKWAIVLKFADDHKHKPSQKNKEDADEKQLGRFVATLVTDVRTRLRAEVGADIFDVQWDAFYAMPTRQQVKEDDKVLAAVTKISEHVKKTGACPAHSVPGVGHALHNIRGGGFKPKLLSRARAIVEDVLDNEPSLATAKRYLLASLAQGAGKNAEVTAKKAVMEKAKRLASKGAGDAALEKK